jgi:membrane protease subunit HflK
MSQNDPQWGGGRNKNSGPPNLDEIFRNVIKKINGLLGNKIPQSNTPSGDSAGGTTGIVIVLTTLAVLWMASGFYIVDEREDAVITRFGRYMQTVEDSGLHWHLPYPIEAREIVNMTEIRSLDVGVRAEAGSTNIESLMLTGDQNIIQVQLEVQYTLNSAKDFLFNNRFADADAKDVVQQAAETAIREVVGKNNVDYVLNEGRGVISEDSREIMQNLLNRYGLGIVISRVNISDMQPPEQVQAAFSDAVKARQDKARLINEGRAYANDIIPRTSGMAARLNEEAQGYRQEVVATAEGDASRFKQIAVEYAKAPQVTRDRMYLDTMQTVFQNTTKVLVDQKAGGSLLYLPLDKLMQMNGAVPAAGGDATKPAVSAASAVAAANDNPVNRALRGERDGR